MKKAVPIAAAVLAIVGFAVFVTWPQALHMGTQVALHNDSYFNTWRLAWVAHALHTDPRHLFDANIFYPETKTLAYSDAMLLEGVAAAPLFWANVSPVVVNNLMLMAGIVGSGIGMFVLARHVAGAWGPAVISAAVFTMAPYRIEHFMHLELQWAMWVPLTLWALHRAVDERSWRYGAWAGIFAWLQVVSSVYYGVFNAVASGFFALVLLATGPRPVVKALPMLLLGAVLALVLTMPYAILYLGNAATLGPRLLSEVAQYSAQPLNYLSTPPQNWLWGWTADRWGATEMRLFPGAAAIALAIGALAFRPKRPALIYLALTALAVELSFGVNGRLYAWLYERVAFLHGFRSPSRFAIIASCAIAMLTGLGARALQERVSTARGFWRTASGRATVIVVLLLLMLTEYRNTTMNLGAAAMGGQPSVYKMVRTGGPGVVLELPLPSLDALPGNDAFYAAWSMDHWHPLVNGYSGYYPASYIATVARLGSFPDERTMEILKLLDVRYLVVHQAFYAPEKYASLLLRIAAYPELRPWGPYKDPIGEAQLFVMER